MNRITMVCPLGRLNVIERQEYAAGMLEYNTTVVVPDKIDVYVVVDKNIRRLRNIDNNVINPKGQSGFGCNFFDNRAFTIFFVDTSTFEGVWKGEYQYCIPNKYLCITAKYILKIENGDTFIRNAISDRFSNYGRNYVNRIISPLLDNVIKEQICTRIKKSGDYKSFPDLSDELMQILKEKLRFDFGVEISGFSITIDEK